MAACRFSHHETLELELAVEEACTNIVLHAYRGHPGSIRISVKASADHLEITIEDYGPPFDPTVHKVQEHSIDEIPIGLWGIPIMRALVNGISYERRDGKNILRLSKGKR
jgi:serine/threonine-protein kinase RsbW